jgi:hypothetical protein
LVLRRSLKDLIKLSTIEPNPAALRAIVDLHTLAIGHLQIGGNANWTLHSKKNQRCRTAIGFTLNVVQIVMQTQVLDRCIEACTECSAECRRCADACRHMEGMEDCANACAECAMVCDRCVQTMRAGSNADCRQCAEVCERCASECEKHSHMEHCRYCADVCRTCMQACLASAVAA